MLEDQILTELIQSSNGEGRIDSVRLDNIMRKHWNNNTKNAQMHTLSMVRRGLLEYVGNDYIVMIDLLT